MDWSSVDWEILMRLREGFLKNPDSGLPDYWTSLDVLSHYDLAFAARIGWKWDGVLRHVAQIGWRPSARRLLDWGCGTGIASRRCLQFWGKEAFSSVAVWDRSPLARTYAADRLAAEFPGTEVEILPTTPSPEPRKSPEKIGDGGEVPTKTGDGGLFLTLSHVLGELDERGLKSLELLLETVDSLIWLEPGTPAMSRKLGEWRERLRHHLRPLAPCPHGGPCALLSPLNTSAGREPDWCHQFVSPPAQAFTQRGWRELSRRLSIDLRSLPVSYLVMDRKPATHPAHVPTGRLLGRPRLYKGYATYLECLPSGEVSHKKALRRDEPERLKRWKDGDYD